MRCQSCGKEVPDDEVVSVEDGILCEDCYMDMGLRIRACDPWGERSKMVFRESHGLEGTEGLTDLQRGIYEFIRSRGKATREELREHFGIPPNELENQFAILRHCRLLKGRREGDLVYLVPW